MELNKTKTVAYDYTFNYFGGDMYDMYNGKIVAGASITLAIRCYKDGIEVKFDKVEPHIQDFATKRKAYLCDLFDVCFDRNSLFTVRSNNIYIDVFKRICGYDRIEYDIVGYSLDVAVGLLNDTNPSLAKTFPEGLQDLPVCEPVEVTEKVFREFIQSHIDDFDISDNKIAQCTSVSFIE